MTATLVTVEIGSIGSTATARCVPGPGGLRPEFTGSSTVAGLRVNGVSVAVGSAPLTIPLLIGSLRLNSTTTTATSVTQRAVVLDTLLTDLVLGEATANVEGRPATRAGTSARSHDPVGGRPALPGEAPDGRRSRAGSRPTRDLRPCSAAASRCMVRG